MKLTSLKDGRTVAIRPAGSADAEALVQLINRCYQERLIYHMPAYDVTPDEQAARILEGQIVIVAADPTGRLVGWCDIAPGRSEFLRHDGSLGMGVDRAYRDAGLGSVLLTEALQTARTLGLERITLHVNASNGRAIRLYEKAAFQTEGRIRRLIKDGNRYDDVVIMGLLFTTNEE